MNFFVIAGFTEYGLVNLRTLISILGHRNIKLSNCTEHRGRRGRTRVLLTSAVYDSGQRMMRCGLCIYIIFTDTFK